ncbi:nuclear transport factor 2 family protein [Alteribacillus sp. YIM 98480]|uniref:nuclear transport factor 2 family protein n=1 Tax=Alteribacillus sp. YIM 98480 TaxID=2606599 RepID=UPI00131D783A|nr:nuclear transport factor 2 family protein [Alteribacillus sp. YIM 98480]
MKTEDKLAIHELLSRASYGLDERNIDMLSGCFAEDAVMTLRIADGDMIGPFDGHQSIMKLMKDSMETQTDKRRHVTSNLFFEDESETNAKAISYLTLFATENGVIKLLTTGIYRDEVVKTADGWKLKKRHLDLELPY